MKHFISTEGEFLFQKWLSLRTFHLASYFLKAKALQNNFRVFKELVFFDLWIPDSGFRFPVPDSGFWSYISNRQKSLTFFF